MGAAEHLAANLILLRSQQNKSLVAFAEELGISKSTLQEIEHGRSPNLETVEQIAQSLGVPAALLLSDTPPPRHASLLLLLQEAEWFRRWPDEDQGTFLSLLVQLLDLYARHLKKE